MNSTEERWQAEVNGQIYDAAFSELAAWIGESALLPNDKVRRGNLRWLEAGKVPALMPFFNAKEIGDAPPEIPVSIADAENAETFVQINPPNFAHGVEQDVQNTTEYCVLHADAKAEFICETCFNNFCENCPQIAESLGKLCPMCGALVEAIADKAQDFPHQKFPADDAENFQHAFEEFPLHSRQIILPPTEKFGFGDFGRALKQPFKFKTSLIFGALIYMFFTLGQQAYAIGGMVVLFAALFSGILANMLTFGILANVIENFSQQKTEANFMPGFEDFSLWNDVIHPFFLTIGTYLVSFGLFFVIAVAGTWYVIGSIQDDLQSVKQNPVSTISAETVKQQTETPQNAAPNSAFNQEMQFQEMQNLINEARQNQLKSANAAPSEERQAQTAEAASKIIKNALPLVILAGLAFLWGVFYFPAACAVAGYTRSFSATMNPRVGWDTIRNLGSDYAQILVMLFLIGAACLFAATIIRLALAAFDLPMLGNIPAIAVMSWVTFYFWVVISCILGFAVGKKADRLGIYRG